MESSRGNSSRLMRLLSACAYAAIAFAPASMVASVSAAPVASKYLVDVEVYFRAFCPACQWFVGDPLLELIRQEEFRNIINLNVYSAAGMSEVNGVFDCEGGELECDGHQWEACIIEKDRQDVVKYVGNLACMEGDESGEIGEWDTKLKNCFTPDERDWLKQCYDKRGKDLLRGMMKAKNFARIGWMPYTLVQENVLGSSSQGVGLTDLQTHICSVYKGPKKYYPDICKQLVSTQKEFAPDEPGAPVAVVTPATIAKVTPKPAEAVKNVEEEEHEMPMKGDSADAGEKVRMEVYWRYFCPGCMAFVSKPLLKLLRIEEFRKIIDFHPVPAAGTWLDEKGNFVCTQGRVECKGHRYLSCAVEELPDVSKLIESLACLESKDNKGARWSDVIGKCFTAEDQKKVKTCFEEKSVALLKKHVAQREKVELGWVPYVLLNSVVIGDARHGIGFKQLQEEVCKAYKGRESLRPSACQAKRLRDDVKGDAKNSDATVIRPCPPKKDGDAKKGAKTAVDQDAPGGAFRRPVDGEATVQARVLGGPGGATGLKREGFSMGSLIFPLACFGVLVFVARRFSGDHKKHA